MLTNLPFQRSMIGTQSARLLNGYQSSLMQCRVPLAQKGPLSYVLRENSAVPPEADDPLNADSYYGASGNMMDELINRLPHTEPVYKNDDETVYMKIEEAVRGTSVKSTVKTFARQKDGRGAYLALISNHAGDTKYRR